MDRKIGGNLNLTSDSNYSVVVVNSSTAQKLFDADDIKTSQRLSIVVSNNNNQGCWARLYPAATDNFKVGVFIAPNTSKEVVKPESDYTGEVSVIMESGGSKTIIGQIL